MFHVVASFSFGFLTKIGITCIYSRSHAKKFKVQISCYLQDGALKTMLCLTLHCVLRGYTEFFQYGQTEVMSKNGDPPSSSTISHLA